MMATGYVHPVADGEITDLKTFALRCARAMGACVLMRDEPMDKEPPRELPLDLTYYEGRLAEAQQRLDRLAMETDADRAARVEQEYQAALQQARQFDAQDRVETERVRDMRAKVAAWEGAPDGLKEFMLEQIERSIGGLSEYRAEDHVRKRDPQDEWRHAVEAVGRAHADIEREKALHKSRNAWLSQLWSSLDATLPNTQGKA